MEHAQPYSFIREKQNIEGTLRTFHYLKFYNPNIFANLKYFKLYLIEHNSESENVGSEDIGVRKSEFDA